MRSTEEILGWIAKERDYQRIIGKRGKYRSLEAEIATAQRFLDEAKANLPDSGGKPRAITTAMRRAATCLVRGLEKHGVPDQESQLVHDCVITRVPSRRDKDV